MRPPRAIPPGDRAAANRPLPRAIYTMLVAGTRRFIDLWQYTLAGPAVSAALYLAVFGLAAGNADVEIGGLPLPLYVAPGLIVLSLAMWAFIYPAAELIVLKLDRGIENELMAPLAPWEWLSARAAVGALGGLVCGAAVALVCWPLAPFGMHAPVALLLHAGLLSLAMALTGIIVGIWADKWDQMNALETFMIMPVVFLSGAFFTPDAVPERIRFLITHNPVFFAIDGVRYGLTGVWLGPRWLGLPVLIAIDLALAACAYRMVRSGYKLKT